MRNLRQLPGERLHGRHLPVMGGIKVRRIRDSEWSLQKLQGGPQPCRRACLHAIAPPSPEACTAMRTVDGLLTCDASLPQVMKGGVKFEFCVGGASDESHYKCHGWDAVAC